MGHIRIVLVHVEYTAVVSTLQSIFLGTKEKTNFKVRKATLNYSTTKLVVRSKLFGPPYRW